jgi:hypothetical protein
VEPTRAAVIRDGSCAIRAARQMREGLRYFSSATSTAGVSLT